MRKIKRMLAVSAAALMLAGCDTTPGWADEPLFQPVPVPVVIVEPETTAAAVEPGGDCFTFGDIAWGLWEDPDGQVQLSRHAVVAQEGDYLTVTTCITDDPDVLRQVLPEYLADPGTSVELMPAADCYATEAEAQAAADALNGGDNYGA